MASTYFKRSLLGLFLIVASFATQNTQAQALPGMVPSFIPTEVVVAVTVASYIYSWFKSGATKNA